MTAPDHLEIRRLARDELAGAFGLVHELRPHLDKAEFLRRVGEQERIGYELVGAFLDGRLVGLAGMRPLSTLVRGAHLHLDDLVVAAGLRRSGIGAALLRFAEEDARQRGLGQLFLDARPEAIPFYEKHGYTFNAAPLMRKPLQP